MSNEKRKGQIHTFVTKKVIGKCPKCNNNIYEDNLFVQKDDEVFHFSCHNEAIKEDNEK